MNLLDYLPRRYRATEDPLRTQRRIELAVVVLAMLFCLQIVYGGVRLLLLSSPEPIMPSADSIQVPLVHSPGSVTAEQRNELLARPVFWDGRRPVVEAAVREESAAVSAQSSQLKDVKLVGVFGSGKSTGIIALVKGKKRRILLGEEIDGWILESIQGREAVLVSGARRETLVMPRVSVAATPDNSGAVPVAAQTVDKKSKGGARASGGLSFGGDPR